MSQFLTIFSYLWSKPQLDNSQTLFAQILGEFHHKNISFILSFHTCANPLWMLEIDLVQWPLEWNQASVHHSFIYVGWMDWQVGSVQSCFFFSAETISQKIFYCRKLMDKSIYNYHYHHLGGSSCHH